MDKTFFTHVGSTDKLPIFGFKIHISATWGNYQNITALMLEFLSTRNIAYKYIKEAKNVLTNFSTEETTAESGKLFTLYPKSRVECIAFLEELYDYLPRDEDGIYILSDRPYKDSKLIFYRYGTFKDSLDYLEEGLMTIKGSDGSIWQDYQKSYFDLPVDVEDIQEPIVNTSSHLSKRLRVTEVLKKQNGGNVYQGELLSDSQKIIVKEAVPHIMFNKEITKSELRNREFQRSHHFDRFIPQPIEKMSEWINDYYIYHYIGGNKLYEHSTRYSLFGMEASDRSGNVLKFKTFLNIIEKIFDLVSYFHDKNHVIHDIHPDNFRFDEKGELFLIDLEMIYPYGKSYIPIQSEIALPSWNKLDGKVADCHKVASMILYLAGK
ncbi:hypothetical protein ACMZ6Z_00535 [Streptococcus pluranimalium]|uniref:class III lanthionine synthetase LanKC N-terminal domain-containing protein n=1 Tax=Streptococcus pluranimalium TaxID=82348 RepID=UPI0039FD56E6